MSLHPRRRRAVRRRLRLLVTQWPAILVLTVVWMLLWGDLAWGTGLAGALLAALVVVAFPLPPVKTHARFRPVPFLALLVRFVSDLVVASFQVAWTAVRPGPAPKGAVVQVRLRNPDDVFLTATAVLSTLVPGSLVIETRRRSGLVFLHVLDIEASGGVDGVRDDILRLEERLLRAFAADDVLDRCALPADGVPSGRPAQDSMKGEVEH